MSIRDDIEKSTIEENKICIVYLITNIINAKKYVGVTVKLLATRWEEHIKNSRSSNKSSKMLICRAIAKYGSSAFKCEILESCNESVLKEREIFWISQLQTYVKDNPKNGYNQTRGGDGILGYKHSNESKQKMREKKLGKKLSKEHRENLSKVAKGRKFTEEHCKNLQLALNGEKAQEKLRQNGFKRSIEQLDREGNLIATFPSIKSASLATGAPYKRIIDCAAGRRNVTRGFRWRYVEENK